MYWHIKRTASKHTGKQNTVICMMFTLVLRKTKPTTLSCSIFGDMGQYLYDLQRYINIKC